jgi:hypothetical protein
MQSLAVYKSARDNQIEKRVHNNNNNHNNNHNNHNNHNNSRLVPGIQEAAAPVGAPQITF